MGIKKLFGTPKRAIISSVCAVALVAALGAGAVFAASAIAERNSIGVANAQKYAFADAGVNEADVAYVRGEFDFEDGQFVFDIEFVANGIEYEYRIKASDGTVIKKETDSGSGMYPGNSGSSTAMLSIDDAVKIALANAGLTDGDIEITGTELDKEENIYVYDIVFCTSDNRYEYKIGAYNGVIYSMSKQLITGSGGQSPAGNEIGADTAKSYALADAGIASSSAVFTKVKLETDDGVTFYDIEFSSSSASYEYKINAYTGAVIEKKTQTISSSNGTQLPSGVISLDAAKNYALSDAALSGEQVTYTKAELDMDDGSLRYDIEFFTSTHEYEYEIDAYTGSVLSKKAESLSNTGSSNGNNTSGGNNSSGNSGSSSSSGYISADEARSIALSHAGLSDSEVTFSKTKLERDDGMMIYEIEFYRGFMEYEYEINAVTGQVIDFDSEYDD